MSTSSLSLSRIVLSLALMVVLAGYWAWLWQRGTPAALADAPLAQLPCVSYAPFRRAGHGPREADGGASRAQVLEDLRILRSISPCVRTYGVDLGLEHVPDVARELGMQVMLGAWLDRDPQATARQVQTALALARTHRDVIVALVIGNEVLLRGEMQPAELARWLAHVRERTDLPVTYADVWEFWLRHADALRAQVDVATVHILPYWEDHPVAADRALAHVLQVAQRVQQTLAGLPLWVGEVGWPAAGRQREAAVPAIGAQSALARGLLTAQGTQPLPAPGGQWPAFNWIEGFDQPWKRDLEGAMGGHWGVFNAQGEQRTTLQGPVATEPWRGAAMVFAVVAAAVAAMSGPPIARMIPAWALLAGMLPVQWLWLQVWCRTPLEWAGWSAFSLVALAAAALALLAHGLTDGRLWRHRAGAALQTLALAASLGLTLQVALDGRYRALWWPLPLACAWSCAWASTWATRWRTGSPGTRGERPHRGGSLRMALALAGVITAGVVLWHEGGSNLEAGSMLVMHLLWCLAAWGARLEVPHDGTPSNAHEQAQCGGAAENTASKAAVSS